MEEEEEPEGAVEAPEEEAVEAPREGAAATEEEEEEEAVAAPCRQPASRRTSLGLENAGIADQPIIRATSARSSPPTCGQKAFAP